jgi:hypothetical protein
MRRRAYFRALLIATNSALILAIPATATKMPSAMPVAIRQYSTAVAAVSSGNEPANGVHWPTVSLITDAVVIAHFLRGHDH